VSTAEASVAAARPATAWAAAGVVLGLLAVVPLLVSANVADMLTRVLAFALLAIGLDLLAGVAGLPSLGQAAPFGVGAYAAALLGKHVTTVGPVQLVAAAAAGAALAAAVGWLLVRSRGTYFLMLTLAVGEIVHELADRWEGVTGGTNGLAGVPAITLYPGGPPVRLAGVLYWYVLAAVLVCAGLLWMVSRSAFGQTLRGIRDNEERMRSSATARSRPSTRCSASPGRPRGRPARSGSPSPASSPPPTSASRCRPWPCWRW
jgi:branched-chain amino acid transport system permease protein